MDADRRALVVGINTYQFSSQLTGSVADAEAMGRLLEYNVDEKRNYDCRVLLNEMENGGRITKAALRQACTRLFADTKDDVLFYFSGHGTLTQSGGYLCAYDSQSYEWGIPMEEIVQMANNSRARDVVMILDCCHGGSMGDPSLLSGGGGRDPLAVLRENMTIIASSLGSQASYEAGGHGTFTAAVIDALEGGAADHMGWVTAPSIYAYIERRFGWRDNQRPVYKSYATSVRVVRECAPLIERLKLRRIVELFPTQDFLYQLDPEHEPEDEFGNMHEPVNKEKVAVALLLKEYRDAGLLRASVPGEMFYWVARRSHTVELTPRGREYWWLVKNKRL
jgi:uncharacterized caspase-like protein